MDDSASVVRVTHGLFCSRRSSLFFDLSPRLTLPELFYQRHGILPSGQFVDFPKNINHTISVATVFVFRKQMSTKHRPCVTSVLRHFRVQTVLGNDYSCSFSKKIPVHSILFYRPVFCAHKLYFKINIFFTNVIWRECKYFTQLNETFLLYDRR